MPKKLTTQYLEKKKIPKILIVVSLWHRCLMTGWKNLDKIKITITPPNISH